MKNLVKNNKKLKWNAQKRFDFETDKATAHFKMD